MSTHRAVAAVAACSMLVLVAAACGSSRASSPIFFTTTVAPTTTLAPTTTTTAPTTTLPPTTTTTTTTTIAPSTSTTSTTAAPTTTTEPPGASVPLRFDGLGDVRFGVAPEDVIAYLTDILGNPTADGGWIGAGQLGCDGDEAREMFWDDLKVTFGDESDVSSGRRHFFTYSFGPPAGTAPKPAGMETLLGVTIGSSVAEIMEAYPAARLIVGDENDDASAELSEDLFVVLTNTTRSGFVTKIYGGTPCRG